MIVTVAKATVLASPWRNATDRVEIGVLTPKRWRIAPFTKKRAKEILKPSDNPIGYGGKRYYFAIDTNTNIYRDIGEIHGKKTH